MYVYSRKYHAARQGVHTPPPREQDPCALCWSATHNNNKDNNDDDDPLPSQHTFFLGSRLAWVLGVGGRDNQEGGGKDSVGGRRGAVGGVGAFYYYTLHTSFTELRLRLKRAQQVAGDLREEVAALGRKVSQLHHTLFSRFSPRQDPYSRHPQQATTTTPTPTSPRTHVDPQVTKTHPEIVRGRLDSSHVRTHTAHITSYTENTRKQAVTHKKNIVVTKKKSLNSRRHYPFSTKIQSEVIIHSQHTGSHSVNSRTQSESKTQSEVPVLRTLPERNHGTASLIKDTRNRQRVYPVLVLSPSSNIPISIKHSTLPFVSTREGVGDGVSRWESSKAVKYPITYTRTPLHGNSVRILRSVGRTSEEGSGRIVSRQSRSEGKMGMKYGTTEGGGERSVREWDIEKESGSVASSPNVITEKVAQVVTVVAIGEGLEGLLTGLASTHPGLTVHLATPSVSPHNHHHPQLRLHIHTEPNATSASGLTRILQQVTTRYVVVAAGAVTLGGLEKLVWAVEHLGVWAAGGMVQSEWGEQRSSCLSSRYAYYEAAWKRQQLGTAGGCQLCHALEGPFLALTVALRHLGWNNDMGTDVGQLELFLRAAHKHHMLAAVCPTSLSTLASLPKPASRANLLNLARRHDLYSMQVPGRTKVTFSCSELSVICSGGGVALPPCCRKDLAALIRFTMDTCEAHGLLCELQEGSLLGAVKTEGVLAWERDADITFHTGNFTALNQLSEVFQRAGYSLDLTDNRWCCVGGRWAGGQGVVSAGRWRAEMWSQHIMMLKTTYWLHDPEPGGSSGWDEYQAGKFQSCSSPDHHAVSTSSHPMGTSYSTPLVLAHKSN
ncbi:hypothetical protein Pmani_037482 [Petrolisthes manimaculis]|uniref:Uncharacterized protein n=1 Tax=Petrolisthes manimaculis TaxID=1843537 RepID=A0AAE1NI59_9EUCA|nr:hypothetical protein Pmani_037482 [Petrolisthes manimaculis]